MMRARTRMAVANTDQRTIRLDLSALCGVCVIGGSSAG